MKRFSKCNTKKGFTLLEVLLATAILVIISSMLMEGFISAMGFSYNSSVYSRSASYNSQLCLTKLAEWTMYADNVASYNTTTKKYVEKPAAYYEVGKYADKTSVKTLYFPSNISGKSLGYVKVAVYEKKDVDISANNLGSFKTEKIKNDGSTGYVDKVADNRTILFYYPTNNGSGSYYGNTHLYLKGGVKVWCYEDKDSEGNITGVHEIT